MAQSNVFFRPNPAHVGKQKKPEEEEEPKEDTSKYVREGAELTDFEKGALKGWEELPEEEKSKYRKSEKDKETAFVRCKLPVNYIKFLEEEYKNKCKAIRSIVADAVEKRQLPKDTIQNRIYKAMREEIPEGEGWDYLELMRWGAKKAKVDDDEAQRALSKLIQAGWLKNVRDKVVWQKEKMHPTAEILRRLLVGPPPDTKALEKELDEAYQLIEWYEKGGPNQGQIPPATNIQAQRQARNTQSDQEHQGTQ